MDGQKALEIDPRTAPVVPAAPPVAAAAPNREVPVWLAAAAALLGPVLAYVCAAVEPAPAHPGAPEPVLAVVLGYATLVAWLGAAVTGLARRPSVLGWAGGVVALTSAMVVACPSTGHHALAGWWYGQMALCAAAAGLTAVGTGWWSRQRTAGAT